MTPSPQERAQRAGVPYLAHVVLTHKCNLTCDHCYQAEHDSEDLPFDELLEVFDQLAKMGCLFLTLGGGEPMARRDFWQIVEAARTRRFAVSLYSNGTMIDEKAARRLKELGVTKVELSLHGAAATTHDTFVHRTGAFERTSRAVELLKAAGVPVVVKSNLTQQNWREQGELRKRYQSQPLVKLNLGRQIFQRDDGDQAPLAYLTTEAQERAQVREELAIMPLAEFQAILKNAANAQAQDAQQTAPCQAARTLLAIQPNGDVTPCTVSNANVMGNVRQRPLAEIWSGSPVAQQFRTTTLASFQDCASCEFQKVCHRCMAISWQESGSARGWSEQVCRSSKVYWSEVRRRAGELGLESPV